MKKEFVPYQQSLQLKELGFNEPCFAVYGYLSLENESLRGSPSHQFDKLTYLHEIREAESNDFLSFVDIINTYIGDDVSAPTFSQAFRWFREKYGYYPLIEMNEQFKKWLSRFCNIDGSICAIGVHSTYEEAELAFLNKLIEIVKNK
jgi:hypothetical protein